MRTLTNREVAIVETIAQTFFPRDGAVSVDSDEAQVAHYIDRFMARLPLFEQLGMRALLGAIEYGIVATTLNPRARFTTASESERQTWLESWERSSSAARRNVFQAVRSMLTIAYTESDAVKTSMNMHEREALIEAELERVKESAKAAVAAPPEKKTRRSPARASAQATEQAAS
jgi:hypothetical protein